MQLKKLLSSLSLLTIPLVSAYNGYSGNLFDYFENEWVMFGTVFAITFALIYFSLLKTFDEHKGVVSILSAGLSLFISIALTKKATLYSLTSEGIADWIILIAFIIAALFIFKFIAFRKKPDGTRKISWFWFTIAIIIAIIFLIFTDVSELLPESMLYGPIGDFIEMIKGILWIIIPIIIAGFVIKLFWGRKGKSSSGTAPLQPQQPRQSWRQRRAQRQQAKQTRPRGNVYASGGIGKTYK